MRRPRHRLDRARWPVPLRPVIGLPSGCPERWRYLPDRSAAWPPHGGPGLTIHRQRRLMVGTCLLQFPLIVGGAPQQEERRRCCIPVVHCSRQGERILSPCDRPRVSTLDTGKVARSNERTGPEGWPCVLRIWQRKCAFEPEPTLFQMI